MDYKLIVTDMDGTLLNNNHEIDEINKIALRNAYEKGINIAIATGRIYTSATKFAQELGIDIPIICCNGAMIHSLKEDKLLYENKIDSKICNKIIDIVDRYNVFFQCYTNTELITNKVDEYAIKYQLHKDMDVSVSSNIREGIKNKDILKMIIFDDKDVEQIAKIKEEIESIGQLEITSSFYNNIEVMAKGVNKGEALKMLAAHLGISREEIIAFGDNHNDLSMLQYAGMGVAVGNAEEEVKKVSNYITSSNADNGVAVALDKFIKML